MGEQVLLRMTGGPHPGDRFGDADVLGGWPLPDVLDDEGGAYVKVSESQLPEAPPPGVPLRRGATYKWQPDP